nr:Glu/Leu/Phe/Val dehydrogenase dimerization domain-containing protein [Nocardiopsis sp. L17-MgMaSL7]
MRLAEGGTLATAEELARGMTRKLAAAEIELGGAKTVVSPRSGAERSKVLRQTGEALRPFLAGAYLLGEDLGTTGADVSAVYEAAGVDPITVARERAAARGLTLEVPEGLRLADLMDPAFAGELAGQGVTRVLQAALRHRGEDASGLRAAVQGFGSVGQAAARHLVEAGLRVVTIADVDGAVHAPEGLDTEALTDLAGEGGRIDRTRLPTGARTITGEQWLSEEAEVLVPAANARTVHGRNVELVSKAARYVVEGANGPLTPDAEAYLVERGVTVLPDLLANAGSAVAFGLLVTGESVLDSVGSDFLDRLDASVTACLSEMEGSGESTLRAVAMRRAEVFSAG